MTFNIESLTETLTYWESIGRSGFGSKEFAEPILIKGRTFTASELTGIGNEEELNPTLNIYVDTAVTVGSYIAEGDYIFESDPLNISTAYPVKKSIVHKGINANDVVRRVIL